MDISDRVINFAVALFKYLYLTLTIFSLVIILLSVFINQFNFVLFIVPMIFLGFYKGIKNREPWIVPVLVFVSSWQIFSYLMSPQNDWVTFISKNIILLIGLSQLLLFSSQKVRRYFKFRDLYLF